MGRLTAYCVVTGASAVALAVVTGLALGEPSWFDGGSRPVVLGTPASARVLPGPSGLAGAGEVRSGARRAATPDAALPSEGAGPRAARGQAVRAAQARRATTVPRLVRVLDGFATGLDGATKRALAAAVYDESRRWGIDPFLTLAVIETESTYRNGAISFMGARGLMQIRPFVGAELAARLRVQWAGHHTLHDPIANVTLGVYYLAQLRQRFGGDLTLALAGYNIGPNAVQAMLDEEREVPTGYVRKVLASYARLLAGRGRDAAPRATLAARSGAGPERTARR